MLQGRFHEEYVRRAERLRDWYACDHEGTVEIRRRIVADGRLVLYEQCAHCGRSIRAVKRANYTDGEVECMARYDEGLLQLRRKELWEKLDALKVELLAVQRSEGAQEDAEWWRWYDAYLRSPEWQRRRAAVLRRARNVCEGCGVARASHVHHLTYARAGAEMLFDLVAVCVECHQQLHPDRALVGAA